MIRSGIFSSGSMDTQKTIIAELLNNMKTRSYLPLLTFKFLTEAIDSVRVLFLIFNMHWNFINI